MKKQTKWILIGAGIVVAGCTAYALWQRRKRPMTPEEYVAHRKEMRNRNHEG